MTKQKIIQISVIAFLSFTKSFAQPFFTVGSGTNYTIQCLFSDTLSNQIYAGGQFSVAGNLNCKYVANWNGTTWDSLVNNLNGGANCINMFNNKLYVGGGFSSFDSLIGQWVPSSAGAPEP